MLSTVRALDRGRPEAGHAQDAEDQYHSASHPAHS